MKTLACVFLFGAAAILLAACVTTKKPSRDSDAGAGRSWTQTQDWESSPKGMPSGSKPRDY